MKIKTYVELEIEVDVDYSPPRPAPVCYNHDSPKFSDPGDDEFLEYGEINFIVYGKRIPVPEYMIESIINKIDGDVIDQCRDKAIVTKADYAEYVAEREKQGGE